MQRMKYHIVVWIGISLMISDMKYSSNVYCPFVYLYLSKTVYSSYLVLKNISIYLKGRKRDRKTQRNLHLLVNFPNSHKGQGWVRAKPRPWIPIHITASFQGAHWQGAGKGNGQWTSILALQHEMRASQVAH